MPTPLTVSEPLSAKYKERINVNTDFFTCDKLL